MIDVAHHLRLGHTVISYLQRLLHDQKAVNLRRQTALNSRHPWPTRPVRCSSRNPWTYSDRDCVSPRHITVNRCGMCPTGIRLLCSWIVFSWNFINLEPRITATTFVHPAILRRTFNRQHGRKRVPRSMRLVRIPRPRTVTCW